MEKFLPVLTISNGILLSCMLGMILSYYAYVVETNKENDASYEAMCDISEHMSCSKVFASRYGKGFGIVGPLFGESSRLNQPNSVYGMLFYSLIAVLTFVESSVACRIQFWITLFSNVGSAYLAYILAFILHDFCAVCVSTYVVNLVMTILTNLRYKKLKHQKRPRQKTN